MPRLDPNLPTALEVVGLVAREQGGLCTTQQALEAGVPPDAIDRLIWTGRWSRVDRGVYLTGRERITTDGRLWAASLSLGPAAVIGGHAAGHSWGILDGHLPPNALVDVLIPERVRLRAAGVRIRRVPVPSEWAHPTRAPRMLTVEHTVLELVRLATTDAEAVEAILRSCRLRLTTPSHILAAMATRARIRRRALVKEVCAELRIGVTSTLERRYRRDVERAHGLPPAVGQARAAGWAGSAVYRDLRYPQFGVIVELDGHLGHESEADQLRDQFRDNAATLTGDATLRYGWLGVVSQSCSAASQVGSLIGQRGWTGTLRNCGPRCTALFRATAA